MEFLLINHPLDCPICDQGGECELQDLSMGFGHDASAYEEAKRSVEDENLGTLIATEMTRCIHCTRCVRFGQEIAGLRELGVTGRGENMEITTYVHHAMKSEVSGNIIDLCPVGALTSKPYRFTARAWELEQREGVAPHDCLGSNVYLHIRRNHLMRVVPKENDAINETWLSDRDRFSYLGLNHEARAGQPRIKRNGQWETVDWQTALNFSADGIAKILKKYGPEQMAAFASPSATLEELYLLQKLMRELGVTNLDHRLQQIDFRDQDLQSVMPSSSLPYEQIEKQESILIVGSNINKEVPLAAIRIHKAFRNGGKIFSINAVDYDHYFELSEKRIVSPQDFAIELATLLVAVASDVTQLPIEVQKLLIGLQPNQATIAIAKALTAPHAAILTGAICENHPDAALIRTLVYFISKWTGAKILRLTSGANSAGAWLSGMVPHRGVGGKECSIKGLDVQTALNSKLKAYFLLSAEPAFDFANPYLARKSMLGAEFVVSLSAYQNQSVEEYADVILPIAPYAETSGTYINVDQTWQTVKGALVPFQEARPAWKILRVLGNLFHLSGFEYTSTEEILAEIKAELNYLSVKESSLFYPEALPSHKSSVIRVGEWPLYRVDAIVRHATELQHCGSAEETCIRMHPETAKEYRLSDLATISQGDIEITLPLKLDERIAPNVVWVPNGLPETADLGHAFAELTIKS